MTSDEQNIGEKTERKRRSRFNRSLLFMAGLGLILSFVFRYAEGGDGNILTATPQTMALNPIFAVILAIVVILVLVVLPASGLKAMDELQRANNINATAIAGLSGLAAFPAWHLSALGGLFPPPTALGMFIILLGTGFAAYAYLWWRTR